MIIPGLLYRNVHWVVLYKQYVYCSDMKFKMAENVSKRFFSETTWTIETKLPRNDHYLFP
jgi:hypothetical protein